MDIDETDLKNFIVSNSVLIEYTGHSEIIVSIPDGITEIDSAAFGRHSEIKSISVPDSVTNIGKYAFVGCSSLKTIDIGSGIRSIPMGCFTGLVELEYVNLFDTIESIDDFAFRGCRSLQCLQFLSEKQRDPITPEEKGMAFEAMLLGKPYRIRYVGKADSVPEIARIGSYAFADCPSFDYFPIKEKAIQLGINAFDEVLGNSLFPGHESSTNSAGDCVFAWSNTCGSNVAPQGNAAAGNRVANDEFPQDRKNDNIDYGNAVHIGESVLITDGPNQNATTNEDVNHNSESLVGGVTIEEDRILRTASGEYVDDVPISALGLSKRVYNSLNRARIVNPGHTEIMVSDVLKMSLEQLKNIRNLGAKCAEEVIEKVQSYLLNAGGIDAADLISGDTIAPGYSVVEGHITELATGVLFDDINVESLALGVRTINGLKNGGIHYLSDLVHITQQQLMSFSNIGAKAVSEIKNCVRTYLESPKVGSPDVEAQEYEIPATISVSALTEPDPDIPVLASEYAVVDGIIYNRQSHRVVRDASVEKLGLSVRSLNCLMMNENKTIASLVGMPYSSFRNIHNLGTMTANEIQCKLEQYLDREHEVSVQKLTLDKTVSEMEVLSCLRKNEFESISVAGILETLPDAEESDLLEILGRLVEEKKILFYDNKYSLYHSSFYEYIKSLDNNSGFDERAVRILQMRASGSTLDAVGQIEGTTRERIRQIEKKSFDKIKRSGVLFDEDKYAYVFRTYDLEKEFYSDYLNGNAELWYYLNCRYSKGICDPATALDDKSVTASIRRAVDKYIHRDCIHIAGDYIRKQRGDIEEYVAERYCKDEVTLDQFFERYNQFLIDNDLMNENLEATEAVRATRINILSESMKLLWKQNQRLRYYDIKGTDCTELLETLNLGQYNNIELSTRKFIVDYPELLDRYDIRDEYELHNLLKKIHAENENPEMRFGRMPSIQFGTFDRDSAVKELLFASAPVSIDDLAEMISQEYGPQPATVKANWFKCISEYYYQGMYSVDYTSMSMPEDQMAKLKEALTDDFYFFSELKKIYGKTVPDADYSLLSAYNLKRMGFLVGSSYIIQNYPSAEAYFSSLLTTNDVVDLMPISKRFTGLNTYSSFLATLKYDMQIIEFEQFQYINIRRLEKLGFTKNKLREYGDRVWSYLVDDDYFTIHSLKRSGFEDELDSLGFGDLFYSSLLKADSRFSWQRIGNEVVFNPKGSRFTAHDFLVDRITKERAVDIDDFIHDLSDIYGISFDRYNIIEKIKGSEVYYDPIMEKLYADYSTYYEEI